ncbi:putative ribonuclease H-like domain-containing protein [Tanacetum coccineum]
MVTKHNRENCDPIDMNGTPVDETKYRSMIGSLMYLTSSKLDIVHVTCLCAWYQAQITEKHLKEVKRIFRYLRGTVNIGLWYTKASGFELTGFLDADHARCQDTFKSTSEGTQFLGEKLVSWSSKKQDYTSLSTMEAEYASLSACCTQVLWMRTQLTDYGFHFDKISIYCDSKLTIAISCNPVQHSRTKDITVCYHFIKEHVEKRSPIGIDFVLRPTTFGLTFHFKALSLDNVYLFGSSPWTIKAHSDPVYKDLQLVSEPRGSRSRVYKVFLAVNTACYTFNRVRVTKPQNKTPYELLFGHKPILSYIRPFGCHVTILNTLSPLGKFDGKSDEGFLVGYSVNSKAFRVYNLVTKRVEVNLHVNFLEEKPNVQGLGHRWMFDLDYLTDSMNYIPVSLQNQANPAGSKEVIDIDEQTDEAAELMVVSSTSLKGATRKAAVSEKIATKKPSSTPISKSADDIMTFRKELDALALKHLGPVHTTPPTSTNPVNTGSGNLNTGFEQVTPGNREAISPSANHVEEVFSDADDDEMPKIRIYDKSSEGIFDQASYDDDGIITDFNNLPDEVDVTTNPTLRIHNAHPQSQILGDPNTPVQTRSSLKKITEAHATSQKALEDGSWVEAMQEELLQFKLQQVWVLVDLPNGAKVIEAIRLFLPLHLNGILVFQMDVKSAFYMGHLFDEEVYVSQPPGFVDPDHPTKVYKVVKALYGLHQAPRAWYATLSTFLEKHGYKRGHHDKTLFIRRNTQKGFHGWFQVYMLMISFWVYQQQFLVVNEFKALMQSKIFKEFLGELTFFLGLQVKQNKGGIFISQDKYVAEILKKFALVNVKAAITPMRLCCLLTRMRKLLDVDVHLYQIYVRFSPKDLLISKWQEELFKYLKGKPNLGLWYPRESPLHLEAFSDSDYGGSNLDRKSTTGGCQFLGQRLISWQCKKQTIVATSTTEAEYVAAAKLLWDKCCGFKSPIVGLWYALTANPTIYDSLVKQFWQRALFAILELDGSLEINATSELPIRYKSLGGQIRDSLQLDDATGITMLPNADLFEAGSLTKKIFGNMKRGFQGAPRPLLPSMLLVATNPNAGQEHDAQAQSQPTPPPPPIPSPTPPPITTSPPPPIPSPTPPPIPTPTPPSIPTPTPPPTSPPPPETEPTTAEYIYKEHSPVHHHFSPSQEQAPSRFAYGDLLSHSFQVDFQELLALNWISRTNQANHGECNSEASQKVERSWTGF